MSPTILCVDDDRALCQILERALRAEGFDVVTAHDGETAVEAAHAHSPDLVLLDVLLPKRDGFAVLEALRAEGGSLGETPVVLLTGCSRTPQYRQRAEDLRAIALLVKPVPLVDLIELARKSVGVAPGARPAQSDATLGDARSLSGDLRQVPFPALLHHLHGLRANGVLRLESGKKRKSLQIRDGRPVAVKSNLVDECFGNRLLLGERITREELDESLRRRRGGEGLQGEVLVAMHLLSERELADTLREQADEKLFEIFEWRSGTFRFELDARLERGNALPAERSPANIVLDGVRRRIPLEIVDAHLATLADCWLAPNESPFYRFQDIDLDPGEDFLLSALDGQLRVADLGEQGEATRRTLYGLLITGLLEPRGQASQTATPRVQAAGRAAPPPGHDPEANDSALRAELTLTAERLRGKGFFEVLGVGEGANDEDVRRAYVDLAKRTHPDRFAGSSETVQRLAEEIFGLVSRAYEALADTKRRLEYRLERQNASRDAAAMEEGQRALSAEQHFQQGEACLRRRDPEGAVRHFEDACRLFPEEGEYFAHWGWAVHLARPEDRRALEQAIKIARRGAKLAPDREKPFLFLGRLCAAGGRTNAAERMFVRAVENRPDSVEALRELRLLHMRREREKGLLGRLLRRA